MSVNSTYSTLHQLPDLLPPTTGALKSLYNFFDLRRHGPDRFPKEIHAQYIPPALNHERALIVVNGMRHTAKEITRIEGVARHVFKGPLFIIPNLSNGFLADFFRAAILRLGGQSPASEALVHTLQQLDPALKEIRIVCHSEGALIVRTALHHLGKKKFNELYPKLSIESFGGAIFFNKSYAFKCVNHTSIIDPVPFFFNIENAFKYLYAAALLIKNKMERRLSPVFIGDFCPIVFHPYHSKNPLMEHKFLTSTYNNLFVNSILNYNSSKYFSCYGDSDPFRKMTP
ncbi:MAG: hypothetical protein ACOYL1_04850 [Chlamydiia bacterium]